MQTSQEPRLRHDNPMVGEALRALDREDRDAERLHEIRRQLRAEMLAALKGDASRAIACPGQAIGKFRPAVDVLFADATDDLQKLLVAIVKAGAEGQDVRAACLALQSMAADNHADNYADAQLLAEDEAL